MKLSIKESKQEHDYNLLGRLVSDCKYYLGGGYGAEKHLWAKSVEDQIAKMKEIYNSLDVKPEWLTMQDIEHYEKEMKKVKSSKNESYKKSYKSNINRLKNERKNMFMKLHINENTRGRRMFNEDVETHWYHIDNIAPGTEYDVIDIIKLYDSKYYDYIVDDYDITEENGVLSLDILCTDEVYEDVRDAIEDAGLYLESMNCRRYNERSTY